MLLLPDVGRTWWSWRHVLGAVGEAGLAVAALDPRGVGASDKTPGGYRLPDLTADAAAVLVALGHRRTLVVGHGWGGLTALGLAATRPRLVHALALIASPTPTSLQGYRSLVGSAVLGPGVLTPDRLRRRTQTEHLGPTAPCRTSLRDWPGPQRALAPLRAVARHPSDLAGTPSRVAVPTVVVRGSRDPLLPGRGAPATTVLDAGHQLPEERPEELTRILLQAAWTP